MVKKFFCFKYISYLCGTKKRKHLKTIYDTCYKQGEEIFAKLRG